MDRKQGGNNNRGHKKLGFGSEFFALGTKSGRDETKPKMMVGKSSANVADRGKREATSSLSNVAKKPKLNPSLLSDDISMTEMVSHEMWEQMATECDASDLVDTIFTAVEQNDHESVIRLLCGAIKLLNHSRPKLDMVVYLALFYVAKMKPSFFCNDIVTSAMLHVLRREPSVKIRQNLYPHAVVTNLLTRGYADKMHWPEMFMRVFIEDAINERVWTDNDLCMPFVENICHVFQTCKPYNSLLHLEGVPVATTSQVASTTYSLNIDDDSGDNSVHNMESNLPARVTDSESGASSLTMAGVESLGGETQNRFVGSESVVERYVTDAVKEQLNKRQQQDCYTRNFLKFICTVAGISEVRYLTAAKIEMWTHNGKLVKFAQQLLSYVFCNLSSKCIKDHEVLGVLIKIRLKAKPVINFYMSCIREMILKKPDILNVLLKLVVQNELSNTRNPNNMATLITMFQTAPDQSATHLAEIYQEFLMQRDDCLRTLRVFMRELVRVLRFDMNIERFCKVFLSERQDLAKQIELSEFRERIFHSMVDLVCLCMMLTVSPQVRESTIALRTSRDMKHNPVLIKFYTQMSQLQLDAISWMYETVTRLFKIQNAEFKAALYKLLLLENPEQYSRSDQWPSEPERTTLLRMISETPVHEETLLRIILIGITNDIPFLVSDTIDIIMLVIKRASAMRAINYPAVQVNKYDVIDFLFSMTEYHHPENIKLPVDYEPPKLAITVSYWKAWLIMLMISSHNPSSFGAFCWDHYPTMKVLIEMCITNQFNENVCAKEELQILPIEKNHILEFETYLAAQTSQTVITEENAILLSQVMLMDPMGPARKVPSAIIDQLKYMNKTLRLGHLLCRSRKPDLLLDIIQRQGTTQSMPWLSDLVQNNEGDFNHLPVQCLCEFLMFNAHTINEENTRDAELVNFLRNLIMDPDSSKQAVCEVLDYIFRRLSSTVKQSRIAALGGLKLIFNYPNSDKNFWLLSSLPKIPHFPEVCVFIIPQLRSACQVENDPELVMLYIQFIAAHTANDPVTHMLDHVIDMAQLIVERNTMFQHIIPQSDNFDGSGASETGDFLEEFRFQTLKCLFVMFNNFIIKLREHREPYEWTEYPDLLMVQFSDGVELPLHLNIIHAFIILLTHSSNTIPESIPILDYWFPPDQTAPNAYLPNMPHEPVQLLPDWLKLKMIRSRVDRLIEAALHGLVPDQIVLFVQNFGTPVNSMSKLLALLDHAVIEQFEEVKNAILNKAYLAQLIEIQQGRGAKNGHFTVKALGLHSHSQTVPDLPRIEVEALETLDLKQFAPIEKPPTASSISNKDMEETVHSVLKSLNANSFSDYRFRRLLHQLLGNYGNSAKSRKDFEVLASSKALLYLMRALERSSKLPNLYQNLAHRQHAFTFIRALLGYKPKVVEDCNFMLHVMKESQDKISTYLESAGFNQYHSSLLSILQNKSSVRNEKCSPLPRQITFDKDNLQNMLTRTSFFENKSGTESIEVLCRDGLLVDWLTTVDPDLLIVRKRLQVDFLFKKDSKDFRFYLLSLICHQTNWETLVSTLNYLLKEIHDDYDYSIVLNFIEAVINSPKLTQGQEESPKKVNIRENIFTLNERQLSVFTNFILKEGESEMEIDPVKYDYKLCSRIKLLLKLINLCPNDLTNFVESVFKSTCSQGIKLKVLQQMYLTYPSVKFIKSVHTGENSAKLQTLMGCQADRISHYLITCLGNLLLKKDFEALSSDTELLIRKLAASHPALFLRQLGVLSSLIQGRAQLGLRALREGFHFHRFIQILRILELLQPMIFDDTYKEEFHSAVECYFTFLKQHGYAKDVYHVLIKFVELLQEYISVNPSTAVAFIEQYVGILIELAAKFSSIMPLQQLVQSIALLQHNTTTKDLSEIQEEINLEDQLDTKASVSTPEEENVDSKSNVSSYTHLGGSNAKTSNLSPHFLNLIKTVKHSNAEDAILAPLQEIESLTSKRFSLLNELFNRLLELIFSHSAQIRSNAFILLIRHLKHNPGRSDINRCTLNAYIQCLRDENSSVAATAVDNMAEIALLLQEYAVEILSVAFSLGIKSNLNTSTQIKRILQTLQLQHGH